ncbi:sugar ABC transporter permease [Mycetocola tolaasinivorans]|uniref:Sugar ABC transporter permease n=1 Tax=Mycetocola tolaasinivorans TaxID=76635 RepID=A0A3L7A1P5_9MICO|nr:sugar ABC transporter permease [Mycetocola tolaasinivorans]RLP74077.1 sugar ABC transporter permease [Mycetocola tolaasinivorans]
MPALFTWIATLPALLQGVAILAVFVALIGLIILAVEYLPRPGRGGTLLRLALSILVPVVLLALLHTYEIAIAGGALVGLGLFLLDRRSRGGAGRLLQLLAFLLPAAVLLVVGLVIPFVRTVFFAFQNDAGTEFVGLRNFTWIFSNPESLATIGNTLIWVLVAPAASTLLGLLYAVFIDNARGERVYKLLVFLPMAISFVGASIIWRLVYQARPEGDAQVGLLNAILGVFGAAPVDPLSSAPANTFALIVVFVWIQVGFAMVVISAAIKGVPADQLEAAALDGAGALRRFTQITVPWIRPTLIVVLSTASIASLKIFDIVIAMTNGRNSSGVLAQQMYERFTLGENGRAAAYALLLCLLVIPLIVINVRNLRHSREG